MRNREVKERRTKNIMTRQVGGRIRGRRGDKISGRRLTRRWR
jgi:hypothetical protein